MTISFHAAARKGTALLTVLCLALAGTLTFVATAPAASKYPSSVKKAFIKTCSKTASSVSDGKLSKSEAKKYCTSALACIEKKLSYSEFKETVKKMQSGDKNPGAKVFRSCEKSAIKKYTGN